MDHLTTRNTSKLGNFITDKIACFDNISSMILSSPYDQGVRINGGRPGARFAPQAILQILKNMQVNPENFPLIGIQKFSENFNNSTLPLVHIGGGHDQIFHLLVNHKKLHPKSFLWVINVDAHCDTRTDNILHSGTPFRQFDEYIKQPWNLIQLGIHDYSNSPSTKADLKYGKMQIHYHHPSQNYVSILQKLKIQPEDQIILSLDVDCFSGHLIQAVSAVNPLGLSFEQFFDILNWYIDINMNNGQKILGIYEFNPIFDNLSQKDARPLALFVYHYIMRSIWPLGKPKGT